MAKSRGRKARLSSTGPRSGDPRRRAIAERAAHYADPGDRAVSRVAGTIAHRSPSDPMQVPALLPLFIDFYAVDNLLPTERCLDDCMTLAHAYAQLGIPAEVRAVELTITNISAKTTSVHGSLTPYWEQDAIHGHTVIWLPTLNHLVDVTARQFTEIAPQDEGPVIAAPAGHPAAGPARQVVVKRRNLRLTYTLAPLETTIALLDHPVPRASMAGYRRYGVNVATTVISILADSLPPTRLPAIPHRRAAALIESARQLPEHETPSRDRRFLLPGPDGTPIVVQLEEIPLPAGTPPVAEIPWCT